VDVMLEIFLVMALSGLAVLMGLGHAWFLMGAMIVAAVGVAVGSGIQMRRYGLDGVFPFTHHNQHRQH
jgi:hypothetical protein